MAAGRLGGQTCPTWQTVQGVPNCSEADDGCMTFYYTNQQSARLMFYHDHSWGITRLNVYAGEAAGYLITDATEQKLITDGTHPVRPDTPHHPRPHVRARLPTQLASPRSHLGYDSLG